jgi:HEAT repeat protein
VGLCGCAGASVQTRVASDVARGDFQAALSSYEREGHAPAVLRALSEAVLLRAARSADPEERRAGFIELSMLGTRANELLELLSEPTEAPQIRAQALRLRTRLGDDAARRELRGLLDHQDPEVADQALQALQPGPDAVRLEAALRSPRSGARSTALSLLGRASLTYRAQLVEASRLDPQPQLRVAALHLLEGYGAEAADAFERATRDPDEQVQASALAGLARVAPERAELLLDRQLGAAASSSSIHAALTLLSSKPPRLVARAQAALTAALGSADPVLRAKAASALQRLPAEQVERASVLARLRVEPAPAVRLALALVLGSKDRTAREVLAELASASSVTAAEAAAELAAHSGNARTRLLSFSAHESALVRITAARLIARTLHESSPIAKLLADTSWQVRDAAAGAVLNVL